MFQAMDPTKPNNHQHQQQHHQLLQQLLLPIQLPPTTNPTHPTIPLAETDNNNKVAPIRTEEEIANTTIRVNINIIDV